ncbi:MAG: aminopeptidase P family protein [Actinobacteria bacterium]|nr:aminopeptidase P family protein [Actinomycetota bacterium]
MRGRGEKLEAAVAARELDRMLVTDLTNVRYLTGFTGTNGAVICGPETRLFLTDFRYTERAEAEVAEWETVTISADWLGGIAARLGGRVGFEDDQMSVRMAEKLKEKLAEGTELVAAGGEVEKLRRVKDSEELRAIAEASKLGEEAWRWALERGFLGRSERDVALATEAKIRELGGEPSFPAIVATGPNGALPHAEPGERVIATGELVVFDMGAKLDGYCSDGTRTFAIGEVGEKGREVYDVVLQAQLAALEAITAGRTGEELDTIARELIGEAGYGEAFGHALGHGVGLEVHEGPRLAQKSDDVLAPGEVVTVEPGIYLAGELGVRIEDFVIVREDGFENLSTLSKDLTLVD